MEKFTYLTYGLGQKNYVYATDIVDMGLMGTHFVRTIL